MAEIEVFPDGSALIHAEAQRFVTLVNQTIDTRGRCLVALSGGATPRPLYALLASAPHAARVDWSRVHLFWGDERCVPPDHPDSNYRMTREALIDHVPLPAENVHRIRGEDPPQPAAEEYERVLRGFFGDGEAPTRSFDLALLGMGPDGHTASIFPGTPATNEARRWAVAVQVQRPREMWRVTLTPVVLNAAANVTFLVAGADKAAPLRQVLRPRDADDSGSLLPAQLIRPTRGTLRWMVDAAAGAGLRGA